MANWRSRTGACILILCVVVLGAAFWLTQRRGEQPEQPILPDEAAMLRETQSPLGPLPQQSQKGGFVSSASCRECHKQEHSSWHDSFHRTMTQVATPETVVGSFDNVTLNSRGRNYHLKRRGDEFLVTMADPDWEVSARGMGAQLSQITNPPIVTRRIVMTTGSHHMQGYWVSSNFGNQLRQLPWYFLIPEQRWVPREDVFIEPPGTPRHFMVWNDNCIVCHSVGGRPGIDTVRQTVSTEVAELGISCEACHGPGQQHVLVQKAVAEGRKVATAQQDTIVNPAKLDSQSASQICGQCHSIFVPPSWPEFLQAGYKYRAGGDLESTRRTWTFAKASGPEGNDRVRGHFWPDGTCRTGGREFLAMKDSLCYLKGDLSCLSCHSMHDSDPDGQLKNGLLDNKACLQCHTEMESRIEEHTHHAAGSSGSLCYSCHMPRTSFALLNTIRSHRIMSPRVEKPTTASQPNACNLCHQKETLAWTADKLNEWYATPRPELDDDQKEVAASVLWLLRGDVMQRTIAAWHMGWEPGLEVSGREWQARFLLELLDDDYAVLRFVAGRSIRKHPAMADLPFDFVGSPEERAAAKEQALATWKNRKLELPVEVLNRLLFQSSSQDVDQARFDRLLKQRDRTPIWLPE